MILCHRHDLCTASQRFLHSKVAPRYEGPYPIIRKEWKHFVILKATEGKPKRVNVKDITTPNGCLYAVHIHIYSRMTRLSRSHDLPATTLRRFKLQSQNYKSKETDTTVTYDWRRLTENEFIKLLLHPLSPLPSPEAALRRPLRRT